jgi:hypothetical protein
MYRGTKEIYTHFNVRIICLTKLICRTTRCHIPKACSLKTNSEVIVLRVFSGAAPDSDGDGLEGGSGGKLMWDLGIEVQVWGMHADCWRVGLVGCGCGSLSPLTLSAQKDAENVREQSGRPFREFLCHGNRRKI